MSLEQLTRGDQRVLRLTLAFVLGVALVILAWKGRF
jgi:hypothetical protein